MGAFKLPLALFAQHVNFLSSHRFTTGAEDHFEKTFQILLLIFLASAMKIWFIQLLNSAFNHALTNASLGFMKFDAKIQEVGLFAFLVYYCFIWLFHVHNLIMFMFCLLEGTSNYFEELMPIAYYPIGCCKFLCKYSSCFSRSLLCTFSKCFSNLIWMKRRLHKPTILLYDLKLEQKNSRRFVLLGHFRRLKQKISNSLTANPLVCLIVTRLFVNYPLQLGNCINLCTSFTAA